MSMTIRPARAADRDSVLAFTRNTWAWGDYLHDAWDGWINDAQGQLAVVDMDGQPVAVAMSSMLSASEGWLQGLRVHPDYRRHGLAMQLTNYQCDWLRSRGATIARLAVYVTNTASQGLVARMGFRHVTSFAEREQRAKTLAETSAQASVLAEADVANAWDWITAAPAWRAADGLWANNWTWQRLTRDTLAHAARRGDLLGVRGDSTWEALAVALLDDDGQHIGYVDGTGAALGELARALSARAWRSKAQYNMAMLPPVPGLAAAFEQAGYSAEEAGAAMLIYERELTGERELITERDR